MANSKRNCQKGFACGGSCIAQGKKCAVAAQGKSKGYGNFLKGMVDKVKSWIDKTPGGKGTPPPQRQANAATGAKPRPTPKGAPPVPEKLERSDAVMRSAPPSPAPAPQTNLTPQDVGSAIDSLLSAIDADVATARSAQRPTPGTRAIPQRQNAQIGSSPQAVPGSIRDRIAASANSASRASTPRDLSPISQPAPSGRAPVPTPRRMNARIRRR